MISLLWYSQKEKISKILFSKNKVESYYFCPKCGSDEWKFPNPLKPAEGMFNLFQFVNLFRECRKCEYVGIFFAKGKDEKVSFKEPKVEPLIAQTRWEKMMLVLLILVAGIVIGGTIGALAGLAIIKAYQIHKRDKKNERV